MAGCPNLHSLKGFATCSALTRGPWWCRKWKWYLLCSCTKGSALVLCSQNKDTKILGRENCTLRVGVVFLAWPLFTMFPTCAGGNSDLPYGITDAVTITAFSSNKYITHGELTVSLQMEGHAGTQCNSKERYISCISNIFAVPGLALHQFGW